MISAGFPRGGSFAVSCSVSTGSAAVDCAFALRGGRGRSDFTVAAGALTDVATTAGAAPALLRRVWRVGPDATAPPAAAGGASASPTALCSAEDMGGAPASARARRGVADGVADGTRIGEVCLRGGTTDARRGALAGLPRPPLVLSPAIAAAASSILGAGGGGPATATAEAASVSCGVVAGAENSPHIHVRKAITWRWTQSRDAVASRAWGERRVIGHTTV